MLPTSTAEHHNHYRQRFEVITDLTKMPDDLLFSYLLSTEIMRVGRELTSEERLTVLDQYVLWYVKHDIAIPHPEWVKRNRERWKNDSKGRESLTK